MNKQRSVNTSSFLLSGRRSDRALTLAKRHRCVPLVDPLCGPGACGAALANESEALVTGESQRAAQLTAREAVNCAVHRAAGSAAVCGYGKMKGADKDINMRTDETEFNGHKEIIMIQN